MKSRKLRLLSILQCVAVLIVATACTPKNISYMQDMTTTSSVVSIAESSIKIEPGDKLSIYVKSKDPELSDLFNLPVITSRIGSAQTANTGSYKPRTYASNTEGIAQYTVTPEGSIDFPLLGMLHVAGMTRSELAAFIKGELIGRNLVKDPVVTVEYQNTGISVLGEVTNPGRYDINRDNLNILEGLALAGDMRIEGNRQNVLVLREVNGELHSYRVDLTNGTELAKSPAFNLKQNDVIYVEPNNMKKRQAASVNGNTVLQASFWVSIASALSSIAVLIFK